MSARRSRRSLEQANRSRNRGNETGQEPSCDPGDLSGEWMKRFGIDYDDEDPGEFFHYFACIKGDEYFAKGAIVRGVKWDKSEIPKWQIVHGYTQGDGAWYTECDRMAYLGPRWDDSYIKISEQLNADGGQQLENHVTHRGGTVAGIDIGELNGDWMQRFGVSYEDKDPSEFSHYFACINGDDYFAKGAIVRGAEWDNSDLPKWEIVHGYTKGHGAWYTECYRMAYLGSEWDDGYIELSEALHAEGGEDLDSFVEHK